MTPSLAIVIGTIGRPTLEDSLDSIVKQGLQPSDQVIVVRDSFEDPDDTKKVRERVEKYGPPFQYHECDAGYHYNGVEQTNYGCSRAAADFVLSLGDDDVYEPGAFDTLRTVMAEDLFRPVLFRFLSPWRTVLWDMPRMLRSHISGQCIAIPRVFMAKQPTNIDPSVDFDWMEAILAKAAAAKKDPLWLDALLVIARPKVRFSCP